MTEAEKYPEKHWRLTVRATNGATWETDEFNGSTKVKQVIKKALEHFIKEGAMSPGDYRLALVVNGAAQPPLNEEDKLEDTNVKNGSLLALVPRKPQTDG